MDKKPNWLKVRFNTHATSEVVTLMNRLKLNTICKAANCPNLGECYKRRTASFMILGNICTRSCRYCNVPQACPEKVDPAEPRNLAEAVLALGLKHVVVTSVARDDLPDGGANHYAQTIREVRALNPDTTIEVLIPDFYGKEGPLATVLEAEPDVLNHNMETVAELYSDIRPQARYTRSLELLQRAKQYGLAIKEERNLDYHPLLVKTGIMVGLGETRDQLDVLFDDIADTGCDILTIGQYLQPSPDHAPVIEYVSPEKFEYYKELALSKGLGHVISGPFVRSSYKAEEAIHLKYEKKHAHAD